MLNLHFSENLISLLTCSLGVIFEKWVEKILSSQCVYGLRWPLMAIRPISGVMRGGESHHM